MSSIIYKHALEPCSQGIALVAAITFVGLFKINATAAVKGNSPFKR